MVMEKEPESGRGLAEDQPTRNSIYLQAWAHPSGEEAVGLMTSVTPCGRAMAAPARAERTEAYFILAEEKGKKVFVCERG